MNDDGYFSYLLDGANWSGANGFPQRILEHLGYTGITLLIAFAIAFPIGLLIGHTGRGAFFAINIGNAGRAVPTLGVLFLVLALVGIGLLPVIVSLILLAIPPILTTTYAGIRAVSGATVDAARGIGMTETQIVTRVEIPNALPIIVGGIRNATLQVISTATLAAYVGRGGLGRYLFTGLATRDFPQIIGGSVVLAVLAVVVDQVLGLAQRAFVSPGVDGRALLGSRRASSSSDPDQTAGSDVDAPTAAVPVPTDATPSQPQPS